VAVAGVVEKDRNGLAFKRPQNSTRLLKEDPEGLRGTKRDTHLDRREVESFTDEVARRKNLEPSGAKVTDEVATDGWVEAAVDAVCSETCGTKRSSSLLCSGYGNVKNDGPLPWGVLLIMFDAIASDRGSAGCSSDFVLDVLPEARMQRIR
jgi:hypothetical protein